MYKMSNYKNLNNYTGISEISRSNLSIKLSLKFPALPRNENTYVNIVFEQKAEIPKR
jgi:hypothetical protein